MPLINFGGILGFAEEIENQNLDFIKGAMANSACSEHRSLFEGMVKTIGKRINEIQRSRRENVTEMILEGIEGFFCKPFLMDTPKTRDLSPETTVATTRALLERTIQYYGEAARKLKSQTDVSRTLETLGKKCGRDLDKLGK